jgi:hypothetical protein
MFSTTPFSDFRTGNPSEIKYTWTRTTRDFAVLVAICPKVVIVPEGETMRIELFAEPEVYVPTM